MLKQGIPPQQLANELNKVKRINQALVVGFSGLLIIMVGVIAIVTNQPVEGSPSPGTCLPLDKGETGCDMELLRNNMGLGDDTGALGIEHGGTGANSAEEARSNILLDYAGNGVEQDTGVKWSDGKTIYRKSFLNVMSVAANTPRSDILWASNDIAMLTNQGGSFTAGAGSYSEIIPMGAAFIRASNTNPTYGYMQNYNGSLVMYTQTSSTRQNSPYHVRVEYTKL